jgi:hypothetical protein
LASSQPGNLSADVAYPYPDQSHPQGYIQTILGLGTQAALQSLQYALQSNSGSIDVITDSAGAQAFANAYSELSAANQARIGTIIYLDPAMIGTLPVPANANIYVVEGSDWKSIVATAGTVVPQGNNVHTINTSCNHTDQACLLNAAAAPLKRLKKDGPCNDPQSVTAPLLPPFPITMPIHPFFDFTANSAGDLFDYLDLMFGGTPVVTSTITY